MLIVVDMGNQQKPMEYVMVRDTLKRAPIVSLANSAVKAHIQEQKALRWLARYRAEAARKGIVCPECEGLKQALRHRLAKRRAGLAPKLKGNLHIFLAYYISNWEAILPLALEPFGMVTSFNWRAHGFDDRRQDWLECRDQMNAAMLETFHSANRKETVDAVVGYLSGYNTSQETVLDMARSGAVIFNFCWDDKLNFPGNKKGGRYTSPAGIAQAVDLNLTNAPDSIIKYVVHGGLAMFWPEAAHQDIHKPYDLPFEYEVSFVGGINGWRPKFIKKIQKMGIEVTCFGNGWENGPLSDEEMVKLYSRSRINLGFAGVGHSRKLMCIKGRDFEVPMSGGLYLTQDNPELSLVYDVGKEIVTYKNEKDCAEKIKWLLENTDKADKIREKGRKRALRDHTYETRWSQVFLMAGLMQEEKG